MDNFNGLRLQPALLHALEAMNFKTPTPIQAAAIPPALEGQDILGTAQTGTGKTGAFGIPLIAHLLDNPDHHALVMTPTRELATQVMATMHQLIGKKTRIPSALLIGGASMMNQFEQLRKSPRLIVGTPGRITDHLLRKSVSLEATRFLVLDETDRMLDMGFGIQIDRILSFIPKERQTLLFSATLPNNILKLSGKYLTNPVRISTGSTNAPAALVKQEKIEVSESEKYSILLRQLEQHEGTVIVFVKTKAGADRLSKKLRAQNHSADAIHGDLRQNQRDRAIKAFQNFHTRIMVATDIAARGLDIPHIETVINYDLPQVAEDYIHRIGRTARNGAEGVAISLVTHEDAKKWYAIQRLLNPHEKPERIGGRGGAPKSGAKSRDRDYARSSRPRKGNAPFERKEWSPVSDTRDQTHENDRAPVRGRERVSTRGSERAPVRGKERDYVNDTQAVDFAAPKKKFSDKKKFSAGRGFNQAHNQDAPRKNDAPRPARKAFSFDDRGAASRPARAEGAARDFSANRPPKNADGKKRFGPKGPKPHKADGSSPSAPGKSRGFAKSKPWASKSPGGRGARGFKAAS